MAVSRSVWSLGSAYLLTALMSFSILLTGCGGGGGSGSSAGATQPAPSGGTDDSGSLIIGITDAEGDFVAYSVDVVALSLTRANGDTVEALPQSTRIDFTELTEVTEFLNITTVPAGDYSEVVLTLDYANADIVVQDENGNAVMASVVDVDGNPVGELPVELTLSTSDVLRIRPGIPAAFSLDFDLDASNEIDLDVNPPQVMVEPFILAMPELETDRVHRARGALASVAVDAETFDLKVRPFRHRQGNFGEVTINVNDDTTYEIDGEAFTGSEGLNTLAGLAENTPVVAGVQIGDGRALNSFSVLAGSSVPWTDSDVVKGVVTARADDTLTVRGAKIEFTDGTEVFRGTFTINLGADTVVSAMHADAPLTIADVSVGARITAFGDVADDQLDATAGRVRLHLNQLTAEVVQAQPLAVDLFYLNGRRPAAFDFAGTGVDPANDADPDFYEVDTSVLPITVEAGDLVRVRGYVNTFGQAPQDYNARTVIDVATENRPSTLKIGWEEGTAQPFTSVAPDRLDIDLTDARVNLKQRGVPRDFNDPLTTLALLAPEDGMGIYAIRVRGAGEAHVYRSFADLADALVEQLDAGRELHRVTTHGRYNNEDMEFTAPRASFVFAEQDQ